MDNNISVFDNAFSKEEILASLNDELQGAFLKGIDPPEDLLAGDSCVYKVTGRIGENLIPTPVTVTSLGVIWSGQGLFPLVKDPQQSVFTGCPFSFFSGFSQNTSSRFIYLIDRTDIHRRIYFRGHLEYLGERRNSEAASAFNKSIDLRRSMKHQSEQGEIISYNGQLIVRSFVKGLYKNNVIY